MDEPFSAVDPVVRAQLQEEFLRLQREIGKTIIMVTHDIDEALKLGDQVAVMRVGGKLAQMATPSELLTSPADEFVADFVGADRGLKRLGLRNLGELDTLASTPVTNGAPRPEAGPDRTLRDALSLMLTAGSSELEVHGVLNVFRHRSLPRSVGQYRLLLSSGAVKLDRAWPEANLAVELDGARYHTSAEDRRRDLARDRELAAIGWVVLRFTYADILRDPNGVRAKVLEVYLTRIAQLQAG